MYKLIIAVLILLTIISIIVAILVGMDVIPSTDIAQIISYIIPAILGIITVLFGLKKPKLGIADLEHIPVSPTDKNVFDPYNPRNYYSTENSLIKESSEDVDENKEPTLKENKEEPIKRVNSCEPQLFMTPPVGPSSVKEYSDEDLKKIRESTVDAHLTKYSHLYGDDNKNKDVVRDVYSKLYDEITPDLAGEIMSYYTVDDMDKIYNTNKRATNTDNNLKSYKNMIDEMIEEVDITKKFDLLSNITKKAIADKIVDIKLFNRMCYAYFLETLTDTEFKKLFRIQIFTDDLGKHTYIESNMQYAERDDGISLIEVIMSVFGNNIDNIIEVFTRFPKLLTRYVEFLIHIKYSIAFRLALYAHIYKIPTVKELIIEDLNNMFIDKNSDDFVTEDNQEYIYLLQNYMPDNIRDKYNKQLSIPKDILEPVVWYLNIHEPKSYNGFRQSWNVSKYLEEIIENSSIYIKENESPLSSNWVRNKIRYLKDLLPIAQNLLAQNQELLLDTTDMNAIFRATTGYILNNITKE